MAASRKIPREPNLELIWTQYQNLGGNPKTTARNSPSSMAFSPPPVSPRSLPSRSYSSSHAALEKRQEKVLANSHDGRTRKSNFGVNPTLNAINEEFPLVERLESIMILPPLHVGYGAHPLSPAPSSAPLPSLRHRRESICQPNITSTRHDRHDQVKYSKLYRRNSTAIYSRSRSPSPTPPPPRIQPGFRQSQSAAAEAAEAARTQLRSWGPINHENAQTADAFVVARSLRRRPSTVTGGGGGGGDTPSRPGRLTVRAIIRPRDPDRQPFLLQRNFDVDALRATIPEPAPAPGSSRVSGHLAHPHLVSQQPYSHPLPDSGASAASNLATDAGFHRSGAAGGFCATSRPPVGRRRSSLGSGELLSGRGPADYESLVRDVCAVPVHLRYARAFLPLLAALLLSGHVRGGDVIYLPLPFAEAWPQTVRYIYTGVGELSASVRENIIYLAGKV